MISDSQRQSSGAAKTIHFKFFRLILYITLLILLLCGGSLGQGIRLSALLGWCVVFASALFIPIEQATRFLFAGALALAVCLAAWALAQSWAFPNNSMANPAWALAGPLIGPHLSAISIAPADTVQALVTSLIPFSIFLACLLLFRTDKSAMKLMSGLAHIGFFIAVYGLLQTEFFPRWIVFAEKRHYLDSLTSVFINRNTTASFFGLTLCALTGLIINTLRIHGWRHFADAVLFGRNTIGWNTIILFLYRLAQWVVVFTALMLTKSRAGIGSTTFAICLIILVEIYRVSRDRHPKGVRFSARQIFTMVSVLGLIVAVTFVFSARAIFRMQDYWMTDPRFCIIPGLVRLTEDNWLRGTGLGTFAFAFPAYKDPACGLPELWLQAHDFFLEGWITLGVFFPIAALAVVGALIWTFVIGIRQRNHFRWVAVFGIAILLQQIFHNSVDFTIQNPAVASTFAAYLAAAATISMGRARHVRNRP